MGRATSASTTRVGRQPKDTYDDGGEVAYEVRATGAATTRAELVQQGHGKDTAKFKMTTVDTQNDEQTIDLHAQLGGKVKVNFKSDYFPMEKMIDVMQVNQIREKTAGRHRAGSLQPAPPPPPLPPMPALAPAPRRRRSAPRPAPWRPVMSSAERPRQRAVAADPRAGARRLLQSSRHLALPAGAAGER